MFGTNSNKRLGSRPLSGQKNNQVDLRLYYGIQIMGKVQVVYSQKPSLITSQMAPEPEMKNCVELCLFYEKSSSQLPSESTCRYALYATWHYRDPAIMRQLAGANTRNATKVFRREAPTRKQQPISQSYQQNIKTVTLCFGRWNRKLHLKQERRDDFYSSSKKFERV